MASGKAPDIVGLRKDGTLDVHEVASATDTEADLRARHAEAMKTLPENLKNGKPLEISNYDDTSYTLPCDQ
jgi:hypothetical protein